MNPPGSFLYSWMGDACCNSGSCGDGVGIRGWTLDIPTTALELFAPHACREKSVLLIFVFLMPLSSAHKVIWQVAELPDPDYLPTC